jgi:ketosteroid isomerase-like protein
MNTVFLTVIYLSLSGSNDFMYNISDNLLTITDSSGRRATWSRKLNIA